MWSDLRTVRPCFRGQWGWWEWRCAGEQCIIWILKKLQHYFWQIRICMSIIFRFSVFSSGGLLLHYHYDRVCKLKYDIYKIDFEISHVILGQRCPLFIFVLILGSHVTCDNWTPSDATFSCYCFTWMLLGMASESKAYSG